MGFETLFINPLQGETMKLEDLKSLSKEDISGALGLESKRSKAGAMTTSLGLFAAGLVVGAVTALMFAPKTGNELREEVGNKLRSVTNRTGAQGSSKSQLEHETSSRLT